MTSTTTPTTTRERVIEKHPIRGAIWGFLLGLSVAIYMVLFAVIPFGDWIPLALCVLAGVAIGVLWAYFAPPKKSKDAIDDVVVDDVADDTPAGIVDPTVGSDLEPGPLDDGDAGDAGDAGDGGGDGDD